MQNGDNTMSDKKKALRISKIVRVVTIAPIMALILLIYLFVKKPEIYSGTVHFILAMLFLTLMPVSAYPLQRFVPPFRDKGRDGQRTFAIIMAVIGYICGIFSTLFFHATKSLLIIYLTYLISGLGVALINKLTPIRASGHACGIVGFVALLVFFAGPWGLLGLGFYAAAFVSSLFMERHTIREFIVGSFIPIIGFALSYFLSSAVRL